MKKILSILAFLFVLNISYSQIGISAGYKIIKAEDWYELGNNAKNTTHSSTSGINLAIDYWFRLKNKRVEFFPEISYGDYEQSFANDRLSLEELNFYFNTNIYFLDFEGDCDCPTFSKEGTFVKKGLFLQIAPGVSYLSRSIATESNYFNTQNIKFGISLGLGLDVGVSDFITLSPIVKYYFLPNTELEDYNLAFDSPISDFNTSNVQQIYFGLRLGFRWNQ